MSHTMAEVLVDALVRIGVKHIFGLIGDSLNPLADAVRRSDIEWVGVRHEEGAALGAAGQAKLSGRLGVCCGTTGPGSTHLVAGLYEAARDHAPVLAISGDMPRSMHGTDYIQATEPNLLFRDASLYTETISSPEQAARVIHQAIGAAFCGKIIRAPKLFHGKTSQIQHQGTGIFRGLPNPFTATRYHSLIVERKSLPRELAITAQTRDGIIMGVRHRELPMEAVQFHP